MSALLNQVIAAGQDFEWYPTTQRMIDAVKRRLPTDFASLMDIGAGDGRVLTQLATKATDGHQPELYAIEKSHVLMQAQPENITPVGVEFYEQNLSCLLVDYIFSNPPFLEFEAWAVRIIDTAFAKAAFLVLPARWKDSEEIKAAIARRGIEMPRVIHEDDFLDAERRSRAVVHILEIRFPKTDGSWRETPEDPFDQWFDQNISTFDVEKTVEPDHAGVDLARVRNLRTIGELVESFNEDYARLEANYKAIFGLDYAILRELGVKKDAVRDGLKAKMAGLKTQYWQLLFEKLDVITSRLSTATKKLFLDRLTGRAAVAFTYDNAYAIVMWAIKHANLYYDAQVVDLFKALTAPENVTNYKSNQRTWVKSRWRYNAEDDKFSHFGLDYRIVVEGYSAIHKSSDWSKWDYPGNLHKSRHEQLDDVIAVFGNLGFPLESHSTPSRNREWRSNAWQDFYGTDGDVVFQAKAFINGNVHLRVRPNAIKALNVEAGRLLGWLRGPADVERELGYTAKEAADLFGSNKQLTASSVKLLTAQVA